MSAFERRGEKAKRPNISALYRCKMWRSRVCNHTRACKNEEGDITRKRRTKKERESEREKELSTEKWRGGNVKLNAREKDGYGETDGRWEARAWVDIRYLIDSSRELLGRARTEP